MTVSASAVIAESDDDERDEVHTRHDLCQLQDQVLTSCQETRHVSEVEDCSGLLLAEFDTGSGINTVGLISS